MSINVLESDERFRSPAAAFRQAGSLGGIDRIGQIFGLAPDVNHVAISDVLRYHPVRGGAPHRILARIGERVASSILRGETSAPPEEMLNSVRHARSARQGERKTGVLQAAKKETADESQCSQPDSGCWGRQLWRANVRLEKTRIQLCPIRPAWALWSRDRDSGLTPTRASGAGGGPTLLSIRHHSAGERGFPRSLPLRS